MSRTWRSASARSPLDFYKRGQQYRKRGMWAMAVAQWRKAVGLAPQVPGYYKQLGIGYAQIKRFDRSLRALEEANRQAPDDSQIGEIITMVRGQSEAQALLTVCAGDASGTPARRPTWRPGLGPEPACRPCPITTSSTSDGVRPARSIAAREATAPSSAGCTSMNDPP